MFVSSGTQYLDRSAGLTTAAHFTHSVAAAVTGATKHTDILVGVLLNGSPYILRGDGTGSFNEDTTSLPGSMAPFTAVHFADVNGDGKADLITGSDGN